MCVCRFHSYLLEQIGNFLLEDTPRRWNAVAYFEGQLRHCVRAHFELCGQFGFLHFLECRSCRPDASVQLGTEFRWIRRENYFIYHYMALDHVGLLCAEALVCRPWIALHITKYQKRFSWSRKLQFIVRGVFGLLILWKNRGIHACLQVP